MEVGGHIQAPLALPQRSRSILSHSFKLFGLSVLTLWYRVPAEDALRKIREVLYTNLFFFSISVPTLIPFGRPRCRWKDNIKIDLQEVGRGCGDWMELVQDRDRWRHL